MHGVFSAFGYYSLPGGNSGLEPPDSIPNSEVKRFSADDSVGFTHVKVGHCQVFIYRRFQKRFWNRLFIFCCVIRNGLHGDFFSVATGVVLFPV